LEVLIKNALSDLTNNIKKLTPKLDHTYNSG